MAVNLPDEIDGNGPVGGKFPDPAVSHHGRARLPLRSRPQRLRRNIGPDRLIQLTLSEFRALDPAGSCDLALQLKFLERLDPALLIGQGRQRWNRRFGFYESSHNRACIVKDPAFWKLIANHSLFDSFTTSFSSHFQFIFFHLYCFLSIED